MDTKDVNSIPHACEASAITQSAISLAQIDLFISLNLAENVIKSELGII